MAYIQKEHLSKIKTFYIYHPVSRIPPPSHVSITATRTAQSKITNHELMLYKSYLLLITLEDQEKLGKNQMHIILKYY